MVHTESHFSRNKYLKYLFSYMLLVNNSKVLKFISRVKIFINFFATYSPVKVLFPYLGTFRTHWENMCDCIIIK